MDWESIYKKRHFVQTNMKAIKNLIFTNRTLLMLKRRTRTLIAPFIPSKKLYNHPLKFDLSKDWPMFKKRRVGFKINKKRQKRRMELAALKKKAIFAITKKI